MKRLSLACAAIAGALLVPVAAWSDATQEDYDAAMAITDAKPWTGNPMATGQLPPPASLAELTADTSDPIALLPPDDPVHPAPGSWTANFLKQLLGYAIGLVADQNAYELFPAKDFVQYAANFEAAGDKADIVQLLGLLNTKLADDLDQTKDAERCADKGLETKEFDYCASAAMAHTAAAALEYLSGSTAAAQAEFTAADKYTPLILKRLHAQGYSYEGPDMNQAEWFHTRMWYFAVTGDVADYVATVTQGVAYIEKTDEHKVGTFSMFPVAEAIDSWLAYSGRSREFADFAARILDDRKLDGITTINYEFIGADAALQRHEAPAATKARLRLIQSTLTHYTNAGQIFKNTVPIGVECRLGRVYAQSGDLDKARALYADARASYATWPTEAAGEMGYCLYQLAQAVAPADAPAIANEVQAHHDAQAAINKANWEEFIYGTEHTGTDADDKVFADGKTLAEDAEPFRRVFQRFDSTVPVYPLAPALIDDAVFRRIVLAGLEAIKDPDLQNHRLPEIQKLLDVATEAYLLTYTPPRPPPPPPPPPPAAKVGAPAPSPAPAKRKTSKK